MGERGPSAPGTGPHGLGTTGSGPRGSGPYRARSGPHRGPYRSPRPRPAVVLAALCLSALVGCSHGPGGATRSPAPSSPPASAAPSSPSPSAPATGRARITIKDFTYRPARLTVTPGTRITVTNKDAVAHTVTATGKGFDTGTVGPGKTAAFTAPGTAGAYPYLCTVHPFMKGSLTVR
ncbi:cupredoxin domain-containing protein [Streptomyces sp. NRRL F-5135]|uniref:cupredoxin domain-containing protein n=1 Tax=Streptomyces sp. NRRL F-5135 TaxID=1463858 RepID=UPI000A95B16F|nr:cupredoxin family copper-binding protein [Streptomyces sp. NRRL F-5135]